MQVGFRRNFVGTRRKQRLFGVQNVQRGARTQRGLFANALIGGAGGDDLLVNGADLRPRDIDSRPGHAHGLAFSVDRHVRPLPRSLRNVLTELHDDVGLLPPPDGDLSAWADQGVLLLNRVLTVRAGEAGSHRGQGWEEVTEVAVDALAARPAQLVGVLWGADAARLAPRLAPHPVLTSAHPSPLSARRGFFGSHPFSAVDAHLRAAGSAPIDWTFAHKPRETLL